MSTTTPSGAYVSRAPKLGLVPSMDGIRGMGVTMLIIGHALFTYVESWVTIIDGFFVLSGFLITTLLIQEHRSTGTISLKNFYWRRGLRLFPSVWLFVAVWLVIGLLIELLRALGVAIDPKIGLGYIVQDGAAAVGYVYHLFFPNGLYVIEPAVQEHRTMWHLWTLGMEEWFYLCIAGTVLVCIRRNWIKQLGIGLGIAFVAIGVARWFAFTGFWQDDRGMVAGIRMIFLQRPDSLMLGVVVAVVNAHITAEAAEKRRRSLLVLGTLGLGLWMLMLNLSSGLVEKLGGPYFEYLPAGPEEFTRPQMMDTMYWFRFGHTLGAFGFAFVCLCLARYKDWWPSRAWSANWLQWMGQRSYTIYIWHALPFLVIMGATGGEDAPLSMQLMRLPFMAAATIAISVLVYEKVEMRVMRSKLRFTPDRGSKTAVLAAQADIKAAKPADFASPQPDGPPTGADAVAESATESAEPPAGAASVRPQRGATDL